MDNVLLSLFEHTKLDDKQRRVYLALLQLSEATVSQVAELARIKRTNAYTIVAELEGMGYVHQVVNTRTKTYVAADPNKIVSELKQSTKSFEEMLPYLHAIQRRHGKPYVEYYNGALGAKEAYSQIYKPKAARYITSIERASKIIPDEVARWQKGYISGKTRPDGHHLLTDTTPDRAYGTALKNSGQDVHYFKPGTSLNVDIALVDGKVFLTSFEEGIHVTVIRSSAICDALSALYDLAWYSFSVFNQATNK